MGIIEKSLPRPRLQTGSKKVWSVVKAHKSHKDLLECTLHTSVQPWTYVLCMPNYLLANSKQGYGE